MFCIFCNAGTDTDLLTLLDDILYLHARVARVVPREQRQLYHRDASYPLVQLDCALPKGGGYLCMGLNNNYDASYYWARSAGAAGRLPVPGVGLRCASSGCELHRLGELEANAEMRAQGFEKLIQPNDGKKSEWCEFLR